jgi:hypothetical protein
MVCGGRNQPIIIRGLQAGRRLAAAHGWRAGFAAQSGCQERIMLILKGNFFQFIFAGLLLVAVLASPSRPLHAAPARPATQGSAPVPAQAPDAAAAEFYGWYLDTLGADQDPLSDRYERFNTYVAQALVDQLAAHLRSGPAVPAAAAASDYFLKVSSYRSAWLHARVRAMTLRQQARQAEVLVTLGEGSDAKQVLGLGMVLENGAWKIRQVVRAEPGAPESSAGPPGI